MKRKIYLLIIIVMVATTSSAVTYHLVRNKKTNHRQTQVSTKKAVKKKDPILQGDLSAFQGQYSNELLEKQVANSNFEINGYSKSDFLTNNSSFFPAITYKDGWHFWSGSIHANFDLAKNSIKRIKGYYIAEFKASNAAANGSTAEITLIPAEVKDSNGKKSDSNGIILGSGSTAVEYYSYKSNWWTLYEYSESSSLSDKTEDINIEQILSNDFSSLAGTWKNGKGDVLQINSDGTTADGQVLTANKESSDKSQIPYVGIHTPGSPISGAAVDLFKIGFSNPSGDQSDQSKPRLIVTQEAGNYSASDYYYRQD
jgi:hypothetical protein